MAALWNIVKGRKSVRSFDGKGISEADREKLERFAAKITNPFGVPVRFVFLDAEENGLSSPVISGEKLYVAGLVEIAENADVAYGFSFERLVLYAWSLGIGTTWIGGTMKRELFEKAAGRREGERMPCISPLGYPAEKRSMREALMRRGVGADSRMPVEKLFFEGSLEKPLEGEKKEELRKLAELVRWAPSAVNKQPWRVILMDGVYHFYEKKDRGFVNDATGDLQKIDVGIALCHFVMGLEEKGIKPDVVTADPGIPVPADMEYVASVK